jgi:hypothetical protein
MTGGHQVTVGENPGVEPGDPASVRYNYCGAAESLLVRGASFDALPKPATPSMWSSLFSNAMVLLSIGVCSLVAAQVWLMFTWANRDARNVGADLRERPRRLVATYVGSSIPKALLLRSRRTQSVPPGFPVAVRGGDGRITWLYASVDHAARIRSFETGLRQTNRRVTVTFYPHSGVIRSIESEGGVQLDLGPDVDDELWDSQLGLPIA